MKNIKANKQITNNKPEVKIISEDESLQKVQEIKQLWEEKAILKSKDSLLKKAELDKESAQLQLDKENKLLLLNQKENELEVLEEKDVEIKSLSIENIEEKSNELREKIKLLSENIKVLENQVSSLFIY